MESTMIHASDLPDVQRLTGAELAQFLDRGFRKAYPSTSADKVSMLVRTVRRGSAVTEGWSIRWFPTGWHASHSDWAGLASWRGAGFPTATAAWVDAELRNWGEP